MDESRTLVALAIEPPPRLRVRWSPSLRPLLRHQPHIDVSGGSAGIENLHHLAVRDALIAADSDLAVGRLAV